MAQPTLGVFDARIIQTPLQGLFRNADEELSRRFRLSMRSRNRKLERTTSMLLMMLRVTKNSYDAICFLLSSDDTPKRKKEFVLLVPPVNRQLLDLLFTLVFMMDDFEARSAEYDLCSYRQAREEYEQFQRKYGKRSEWRSRLQEKREWLKLLEEYLSVTSQQKAKPGGIPYWVGPYRLMRLPGKSQSFMKFLETWIYGDTSAQAHLNPAGLYTIGLFLFSDFAPEGGKQIAERNLERYTYLHFTRTLITVLAILTEIDSFCRLDNKQALAQLWVTLAGYVSEADDVYKQRYQSMLA